MEYIGLALPALPHDPVRWGCSGGCRQLRSNDVGVTSQIQCTQYMIALNCVLSKLSANPRPNNTSVVLLRYLLRDHTSLFFQRSGKMTSHSQHMQMTKNALVKGQVRTKHAPGVLCARCCCPAAVANICCPPCLVATGVDGCHISQQARRLWSGNRPLVSYSSDFTFIVGRLAAACHAL